MRKSVLIRIPYELSEQINLLAGQYNVSRNKMYIKILYRGIISFLEAVGGNNEN